MSATGGARGGNSDPYCVPTAALSAALNAWRDAWTMTHSGKPIDHLAEKAKIDPRKVGRIFAGTETTYTSLDIADRLVTAIDRPDLFASGAIPVLPRRVMNGHAA